MTTNKDTMALERMFAIGSPARTKAFKTCSRCQGTGWWQLGRRCFKCGGAGKAERVTLATQIRDKLRHVAEVRGLVTDYTARLASGPRWARSQIEGHLAQRTAQLTTLEAELAALEAQS